MLILVRLTLIVRTVGICFLCHFSFSFDFLLILAGFCLLFLLLVFVQLGFV